MVELKSLDIKQYFSILISILIVTDLSILLNIPFLRQILGFLSFTIIPGILILHILRLNKIEFLKKFVLSVGLSVAFLMFAGLLVNGFYPLIIKPLSLELILISFNVILIILAFFAYKRNKDDFDINEIFNFKLDLKDKFASTLIFPIIFPFMAVFGTHLMNTQGNNIILLAMLFLIPAYVVAAVYLRDRIPDATYPVAVWMIGMSLLLMHGLTSYHLMGRDIHTEFYCFRLALSNFHWDISKYYNSYNACLSVTILPVVYHTLSNTNGEYIFKLFFGLIGSITPLGIYIISKKYIGKRYAFFASLLLIFQLAFIYSMQSSTKQEIATLFFVLAILVLFDVEVEKFSRKILFLIFMFSVVVSHYTTAYIFFILMVMILLTLSSRSFFTTEKASKFITAGITVLFFSVIFFWYSQVTQTPFNACVDFFEQTFRSLGDFFVEESRNDAESAILGMGWTSIPNGISVIVHNAIFVTIGIGVITLLWKYRSYKEKIDADYLTGIYVSFILLISFVLLPFVSKGYGGTRFFVQALVFLAPVFVIGGNTIAKIIRRPKMDVVILLILLISLFSCVTYLQYHFYGIPVSPDYENEGIGRDEYYIYNQELICAKWLSMHELNDLRIHSDKIGYSRLMLGYDKKPNIDTDFFKTNKTIKSGYIYLRYVNVNKNTVHETFDEQKDMSEYSHLFITKSMIYDNGGAEVYK